MTPTSPLFHPEAPLAASFWRHRATVLAAKLNFHHWLARLVPKLFVLLVLAALFDLFRRETGLPLRWSVALLLLGTAVVSAWAWIRARRHFCTWTQAMVRLETVLGLHNQLSSARDGVVAWPAPRPGLHDGYAANWKQILLPLLAGIVFLGAAHLIPVSPLKLGASSGTISEPPDFTQVQNWINALKADDLIEPAKLQDMQSALDKLRQHPAQDWYTQSNLEAANSLKELTEQSMNALSQDLDQADQAVESMANQQQNGADAGSLKAMQDKLSVAAENLASGNLPLKRELVDQMKGAGNLTDKALSASQLADLHDKLKKGQLSAQTAPKPNGSGLSSEMEGAMASAASGHGAGRYEMHTGMGRGSRDGPGGPNPGGTGGGRTSAPLELQPRDKTTPEGALTSVSSDDMSHTSLGETTKITASKPTVDPATYAGNQGAGAAQVNGNGGEAVWRSTYDPQEADTLSRFFK
jgi:hypothetical protein